MGDAVVDVVTEVAVAVVVSKAATYIAEKVGISDSMANLIGVGAAGYVAHARSQLEPHPIFGGGQGAADAPSAGMDLSTGIQGVQPPASAGQPVAPSSVAPSGASGAPDDIGMRPGGTTQAGGVDAGMLTQGQSGAGVTSQPGIAPKVESQIVEPPVKKKEEPADDSYWSKLFSPERTMDLLLAGIGGAAKQDIAKEEREYPEKVAKANAAAWTKAGTSNLGTLRQSFPGQGYLSSYQQ